jgi:hypothetical protein
LPLWASCISARSGLLLDQARDDAVLLHAAVERGAADAEALGGEVAGWYLADEVNDGDVSVSGVQNDVVISAGQAFLIYQNTGATISLPSAL